MPISATQYALGNLSNTLYRGFRGLGEADLKRSENELKRAGIQREVGLFERYQKPELERQLEWNNAPAHLLSGTGMAHPLKAVHFAQLKDDIEKLFGGEINTSEGFVGIKIKDKESGKMRWMTNAERKLFEPQERAFWLANLKQSSALKDQELIIEEKLDALNRKGVLPENPEYQQTLKNLDVVRDRLDLTKPENVRNLIRSLENQRQALLATGISYPKAIDRLDKEISDYTKLLIGRKPATAPSLQRKTRTWVDETGAKWSQDYDFNPKTGKSVPFGEPYLAELSLEKQTSLKAKTGKRTLNDLKLQTWDSYLGGNELSEEQARLIGVDKDPYISIAAQQVANDLKLWKLPLEEKVQKILETADLLREANKTPKESVEDPLGIR